MTLSEELPTVKAMESMPAIHSPIFIGGTGRSGTSILGSFLDSHKQIALPIRENKLIAERFGVRSLINELSHGFDYKANHYTIQNFILWSQVLRQRGFCNPLLKHAFKLLPKKLESKFPIKNLLQLLNSRYSAHSVGGHIGLKKYDHCVASYGISGQQGFEWSPRPASCSSP